MNKQLTNVVLTILTLLLLCAFAMSVACGNVTEEADGRYRDAIEAMQSDME